MRNGPLWASYGVGCCGAAYPLQEDKCPPALKSSLNLPVCLPAYLPICLTYAESSMSSMPNTLHIVYCLPDSRVYLTVTRIPPSPSTSPWLVRNWTGQDCRKLFVPRAGQIPWVLCPWVTHGRQELQEVCLMLGAVRT